MAISNLAIVMVDGTDIEAIVADHNRLIGVLDREAQRAMQLKNPPDEEAGRI